MGDTFSQGEAFFFLWPMMLFSGDFLNPVVVMFVHVPSSCIELRRVSVNSGDVPSAC